MAVDPAGNVYISGYTRGSFDGINAGGADAFLVKYDGSGDPKWSRQLGTSGDDMSYSVAVDSAGNIYISGSVTGNLDDGTGVGGEDIFLACYDPNGILLWTKQIGTIGNDISRSVAIDVLDNVYISGYTHSTLDGMSAGGTDAFLIKFQPPLAIELIPGDANRDGMVDVGDLGILAANYGQSNKLPEQGDFNRDGVVDVGDLGILAANYGQGTVNTTLDFNADDIRTFDETTNKNTFANNNTRKTNNLVCNSVGLPLVAGILLTCLLVSFVEKKC